VSRSPGTASSIVTVNPKLPTDADLIVAFATSDGRLAFNSSCREGSGKSLGIFTKALAKRLQETAFDRCSCGGFCGTLDQALTLTNGDVAEQQGRLFYKQSSNYCSHLRMPFLLVPKTVLHDQDVPGNS